MPQMGYDMEEGTVVRWLVAEGSEVKMGDAIAEIETDKAVVEFESTVPGVLRKILVAEGATVPVGRPIAIVGTADEEIPEPGVEEAQPPEPEVDETPAASEPGPTEETASIPLPQSFGEVAEDAPAADRQRVRATPIARELADERGIDLRAVKGTGPMGRITKNDVLSFEPSASPAVTPPPAGPAPGAEEAPTAGPQSTSEPASAERAHAETVPLSRMRQQIARVTVKSKQEIPHFYVSAEIDMSRAMELRRQINATLESQELRVSVNDMIIKACVEALKKYPKFNAFFADDGIQMNDAINVGIAIAEEAGLIVPAVMDCGNKTLAQIAGASRDLIERSKSGTLHPQEYTGGTFAISNLGMFDVTSFVAIIQPPQSAVLAVGTVSERPVVQDGEVMTARMMNATLSVDHRVSDGAEGAQFIVEVKRLLEDPLSLVL